MKQIVIFTAVILAILLAFAVAWQLLSIVLLFLLSLVIAATMRAPIEALIRRRFSRALAMLVVYGLLSGFIIGLLLIISSFLMQEIELLLTDVTTVYSQMQMGWLSGYRLGPLVASRLPSPEQVALWAADDQLANLAQTAMGFTQNLANIVSQLILAIVLSIYWTADRLRFERLWLSLLPTEQRIQGRTIWRTLEDGVGAYTRSELAQTIVAGGLLTLGYWMLGLRYPFLLALIAALAWLIPVVGGLIALVPLTTVAWLDVGSPVFWAALLYTIIVLAVMKFVSERLLYHHSRYQRVLVLLVMIALVDVYGLMGLLIAPILATAIQIFLTKIMAASTMKPPAPAVFASLQAELSSLQARLDEVRALIQQDEIGAETKRLVSLAEQLAALMAETEAVQVRSQRAELIHIH